MASPNEEPTPILPAQTDETHLVKFVTEKNANFRTFHTDGSWGMLNQTGNIQLNFYLERPVLPDSTTYEMDGKGIVTKPVEMVALTDSNKVIIIREYQTAVTMSLSAAKQVYGTLRNFIEMAENLTKAQNPNDNA